MKQNTIKAPSRQLSRGKAPVWINCQSFLWNTMFTWKRKADLSDGVLQTLVSGKHFWRMKQSLSLQVKQLTVLAANENISTSKRKSEFWQNSICHSKSNCFSRNCNANTNMAFYFTLYKILTSIYPFLCSWECHSIIVEARGQTLMILLSITWVPKPDLRSWSLAPSSADEPGTLVIFRLHIDLKCMGPLNSASQMLGLTGLVVPSRCIGSTDSTQSWITQLVPTTWCHRVRNAYKPTGMVVYTSSNPILVRLMQENLKILESSGLLSETSTLWKKITKIYQPSWSFFYMIPKYNTYKHLRTF